MLFFPQSFLDAEGHFLEVIPADMVPVLYFMVNGRMRCAACMNAVSAFLDPFTTEERDWFVVDYELLYEGPAVECDHCHKLVATLYGESDEPHGIDDIF